MQSNAMFSEQNIWLVGCTNAVYKYDTKKKLCQRRLQVQVLRDVTSGLSHDDWFHVGYRKIASRARGKATHLCLSTRAVMTLSLVYLDTYTGVLSSQHRRKDVYNNEEYPCNPFSVVSVNVKKERDVCVNATQAKARANGVL